MKSLILTLLTLLLVVTSLAAQTSLSGGIATTPSGTDLNLRTNTSTTNRLTIVNASGSTQGFVGIGISPTEKFHVSGNARADQFNAVNGSFNVPNPSSDLTLKTNGTTRLLIDKTNGRVRIGSTAPAYELDVTGTVNATNFKRLGVDMVSSQWVTSSANINYTAGIVSIGTATAPVGYKLAIGGKAVCEEVVVKLQANWPDYVFESEYKLPTLTELQLFIAKNKHLPGIPTAKEVSENGIAVGEMNAKLLQKIEELTLYLIQQDNRIRELENQVKSGNKSNQE